MDKKFDIFDFSSSIKPSLLPINSERKIKKAM